MAGFEISVSIWASHGAVKSVIEEEFLRLKNDYTIILVTHILRQAKRLADYVVFMYYGEIVEYGTAKEIFEHPKTEILKEYLRVGH